MNWLRSKDWNMFGSGLSVMLALWEVYSETYWQAGVSVSLAILFFFIGGRK